jgi:squalene synthase HpnC/squalene synthase HpnD
MASIQPAVRTAYDQCRRLARRHYENFPTASRLVPHDKRDALAAIYAFARYADDVADEPGRGVQAVRLQALAVWRKKLEDCYAGKATHPVFIALHDAAQRFGLSREHFENLLRAFESDVRVSRHQDFDSLLSYCTCSANPVGRLVLELFDHRDPELFTLSDKICTALQLTNFWQDVRVDFERDRIYLPLDDLNRFQYSLEDLRAHTADSRWRQLMRFECRRTRELFEQGRALPERVVPELRRQLRLTWLGGTEILSRIEAAGYDVFHRRPSLRKRDFLRLYFRARSPFDGVESSGAGDESPSRAVSTSSEKAEDEPQRPQAGAGPPAHALRRPRKLTNAHVTNFYYSFVFLPREKRRAIEAVYAFARRGDDIVDGNLGPKEAARAIAQHRAQLDAAYAPAPEATEELRALAEAVQRFKIPRQYFADLIAGMEMDLEGRGLVRYTTFDDLARYCFHVAGTVGLIAVEIFGYRDPRAHDYALNLGTALQLVNILRDVESDARGGRIYIPREDLERVGVRPSDLEAKRCDERFIKLMEFECARARDYFESARKNLAPEDRRSMIAAEIMGAIYWRILKRIVARGYNVFGERVRISRPQKFWTALTVYLGKEWFEGKSETRNSKIETRK